MLLLLLCTVAACNVKKEETPVIPPLTFPLSQEYIGYGIINVSYTRVTEEPEINSPSPGYLRQGAVVRIYERKQITTEGKSESWLFVEEACKGWLKETFVDVYGNESQAQTASGAMGR
jgi:hypothetical protein